MDAAGESPVKRVKKTWLEEFGRTEETRSEEREVLSLFVCVCVVSSEIWNSKLQCYSNKRCK